MGIWRTAWIGLAGAALVAAGPAAAFCGGITSVMMPLEFAKGSAAIDNGLAERVSAFARTYGESDRTIDHLAVTVMGDLGEGAEYDAATAQARTADTALAEARLTAIRDRLMLGGMAVTDSKVRPTRQVFSAADMAANPMLNPRVRAGVFIFLIVPRGPVKPGEPVPLC